MVKNILYKCKFDSNYVSVREMCKYLISAAVAGTLYEYFDCATFSYIFDLK